jgi:acetyl-CoA synthetase
MTSRFALSSSEDRSSHLTPALYQAMYDQSVTDPETFWGTIASGFEWMCPWTRVKNTRFTGDVSIRWFEGARLNITVNCVDRHAKATPNKTAIVWEGDDAADQRKISYAELLSEVSKTANALKSLGVKKGDRVTIYMPMVPEAAFAMLACARIGAIHSVVFAGFSPDSIRGRVEDCDSDFIITANVGRRAGKKIPLKENVDKAIVGLNVRHVLVLDINVASGDKPSPLAGEGLDGGLHLCRPNSRPPLPTLSRRGRGLLRAMCGGTMWCQSNPPNVRRK